MGLSEGVAVAGSVDYIPLVTAVTTSLLALIAAITAAVVSIVTAKRVSAVDVKTDGLAVGQSHVAEKLDKVHDLANSRLSETVAKLDRQEAANKQLVELLTQLRLEAVNGRASAAVPAAITAQAATDIHRGVDAQVAATERVEQAVEKTEQAVREVGAP